MGTQHNHGPNFGKKVEGCLRCDELANGALPVNRFGRTYDPQAEKVRRQREAQREAKRSEHIRHHYASGECREKCGPVCTKFDW